MEIRAKGGNFLLNFGPRPDGRFPPEQLAILNEISLWMFINHEAFEQTVACEIIREGNIWFLQRRDEPTVYAFLLEEEWQHGERRSFRIESLQAADDAKIAVLGHSGKVLEYNPDVDPAPTINNSNGGIEITVMRAQRIYNDRMWPNPLVIKLEGVAYSK